MNNMWDGLSHVQTGFRNFQSQAEGGISKFEIRGIKGKDDSQNQYGGTYEGDQLSNSRDSAPICQATRGHHGPPGLTNCSLGTSM